MICCSSGKNDLIPSLISDMLQSAVVSNNKNEKHHKLGVSSYKSKINHLMSLMNPEIASKAAVIIKQFSEGFLPENAAIINKLTEDGKKAAEEIAVAKQMKKELEPFEEVLEAITKMRNNKKLLEKLGKNANKEFEEHLKKILTQTTGKGLEKALNNLSAWCDDKEKQNQEFTKKPFFKKLKEVIKSAAVIVSAKINRDPNATEKINEFTSVRDKNID